MTQGNNLADAASEQIQAADARLRELQSRQQHLTQERASAVVRGDQDRVVGTDRALINLGTETAHLRAQRAKWVGALVSGKHPETAIRRAR